MEKTMSKHKRIVYTNKDNQQVMVKSILIGDERVKIVETTNPEHAKYFTNRAHATRMCDLIETHLGVSPSLENCEMSYVITNTKRGDKHYLRYIDKGLDNEPYLRWSCDLELAIVFKEFETMINMQTFVDGLRKNDNYPKCGHVTIYK